MEIPKTLPLAGVAELIRSRRTVHDFIPSPTPPDDLIEQAIALACCAPNHHLTHPWRFYRLGPQAQAAACELNYRLVQEKRGEALAQSKLARWRNIPGWVVISCRNSDNPRTQREDLAACSCGIQNMMLYLWSAGVGSKWSSGALIDNPEFYRLLEIDPQQESVIAIFWYGYPAKLVQPPRPAATEFIQRLP